MRPKKNTRRSEWRVMNRCFNMLLRLLRGSVHSEELRSIVHEDARVYGEHEHEYDANKRFERDRKRLRDHFSVQMNYDRTRDEYNLTNIERALIDLPEDAVIGLAFLDRNFTDDTVPMQAEVQYLLSHIKTLLPPDTQKSLRKHRSLLEIDLKTRDSDTIDESVFYAVETTCAESRLLEFNYLSPQQDDETIRIHRVEPIRHFFDPSRGHWYLEAYALEGNGPKGRFFPETVITYRMGRIRNSQALPTRFMSRRIQEHQLDYILTAKVARQGVSDHFLKTQVFPNDDGSATVRAVSRNLFFDLRTLLHYGANCRVIGGDDALYEMKKIVKDMATVYAGDTDE